MVFQGWAFHVISELSPHTGFDRRALRRALPALTGKRRGHVLFADDRADGEHHAALLHFFDQTLRVFVDRTDAVVSERDAFNAVFAEYAAPQRIVQIQNQNLFRNASETIDRIFYSRRELHIAVVRERQLPHIPHLCIKHIFRAEFGDDLLQRKAMNVCMPPEQLAESFEPIIFQNIEGEIISLLYILLIFLISIPFYKINQEHSRKVIHIMLGFFYFIALYYFTEWYFACFGPLLFIFVNYFSVKFNFIKLMLRNKKNKKGKILHDYGTVYYAFSLTVITIYSWKSKKPEIGLCPFLSMAFGDGLACVFGSNIKTIGNYAFFIEDSDGMTSQINSITLNEGLERIERDAIEVSAATIRIPSTVNYLAHYAFEGSKTEEVYLASENVIKATSK